MVDYKFQITNDEIKNWNNYGFIYRPNHLKDKINDYIKFANQIEKLEINNRDSLFYYEEIMERPRICRIEKFLNDNKFLRKHILGDDILGFINKLNNKPFILYKEKINIKSSGGSGYSAHQDATAYHKLHGHITCLIALTKMNTNNGCLYISKLKNNNIILPNDDDGCITKDIEEDLSWEPVIMSEGDCLFFNSFVPHKSNINYTDKSRKGIYLTFNPAEEGNLRNQYYKDRNESLKFNKHRISTIGHFQGKNFTG